jgi:hypothetical protein
MVMAMRAVSNKEGKGSMGHSVGNKGGMRQRGRWRGRQEQWGQGCRASNGDVGDGNGKGNNLGDGDGNEAGGQQRGQGRGWGWQGEEYSNDGGGQQSRQWQSGDDTTLKAAPPVSLME